MARTLAVTLVLVGALLPSRAATAQESNFTVIPSADPLAAPGWTFTPSIGVGSSWDDNVLVRGSGDQAPGDVLNIVAPSGMLTFNGGRGQLSASYDGSFFLYRQFNTLDSYDQRSSFFGRRLLTKHVAVFVRNSLALVPTTELAEFVAVPFIRTGSRLEDLRTGLEAAFTKYTSAVVSYDFEAVDFDQTVPGAAGLYGGHSYGANASLRHLLSARLALTAEYDLQHALLRNDQAFNIQNWWAGAEYRLSEETRVFGSAGLSRLEVTQFGTNRTGPAWRAGLIHSIRTASVDLLYSRSFVPSYGFGGTMQNEDATARLRLPITRRLSTSTAVAWRRDDPLTLGGIPLRTFWLEGTIGYAASRWFRIEGFYAGTHQTITRPGGVLNRNRAGIQVVTAAPMRIQ